MPTLYSVAIEDGRFTIDHFDTIWRRLDGHKDIRREIADRERDLITSLRLLGEGTVSSVISIHRVRGMRSMPSLKL